MIYACELFIEVDGVKINSNSVMRCIINVHREEKKSAAMDVEDEVKIDIMLTQQIPEL